MSILAVSIQVYAQYHRCGRCAGVLTLMNENRWETLYRSGDDGTAQPSSAGLELVKNSVWPSFLRCPFASAAIAPGKAFNIYTTQGMKVVNVKRPSAKVWSMDYGQANSFDAGGSNYGLQFGCGGTFFTGINWGGECPGGGLVKPGTTWWNAQKTRDYYSGRHNGSVNVLHFDGSIRAMPSRQAAEDHFFCCVIQMAI